MEDMHVNGNGQARERVQALLADKSVTQAEVARQAGISGSAVSRWLKGAYEGDNDAVAEKVVRWLNERDRQTGFLLPDEPAWVGTPTSERIMAALSYGQMAADLVVVYGGAGLGKTRTVEHYAASRPNVWVATMSPDTATPSACLEEICDAMNLREGPGTGAARMRRTLVKRLQDTRGLLVVDEAQHLAVNALETVRSIHDRAHVGLALVGNERIYSRLSSSGQAALFAQLYSRVGKRLSLGGARKDDVAALTAPWSVGDPAALGYLWTIARTPGALRGMTKTLRLATMMARGAGEPLELRHIKRAWAELGEANRLNGNGKAD